MRGVRWEETLGIWILIGRQGALLNFNLWSRGNIKESEQETPIIKGYLKE